MSPLIFSFVACFNIQWSMHWTMKINGHNLPRTKYTHCTLSMGQAASKAASAVKQSTSGVVVSNHGPKARAAAGGGVVGGGGHDASAVDHGRTRAPGGEYSPTRGAGLEVNTGEMMPEMPPVSAS